jgi:hypothetical protein
MTLQEINSAIICGTFTNDELNSINDAVRFARARIASKTKYSLRIGDQVKFTNSRTGREMTGTVKKIAIKNVTVMTPEGGWRVPANMLSPA